MRGRASDHYLANQELADLDRLPSENPNPVLRVMPDGRYKVRAAINRPNKSDYLPLLQVVASAGDPFFVAGQSYQGGTLVVGVTVDPKKTTK